MHPSEAQASPWPRPPPFSAQVVVLPGTCTNDRLHLASRRHPSAPDIVLRVRVQGDRVFRYLGALDVGVVIPLGQGLATPALKYPKQGSGRKPWFGHRKDNRDLA